MFNKKLKKRIKTLEFNLGFSYNDGYHENLEYGELRYMENKIAALVDYLDVEKVNGGKNYKYKKKAEK